MPRFLFRQTLAVLSLCLPYACYADTLTTFAIQNSGLVGSYDLVIDTTTGQIVQLDFGEFTGLPVNQFFDGTYAFASVTNPATLNQLILFFPSTLVDYSGGSLCSYSTSNCPDAYTGFHFSFYRTYVHLLARRNLSGLLLR